MKSLLLVPVLLISLVSCGGFEAKRVDAQTSDEKGLKITDNWMSADTSQAVVDILKQIKAHKGFQRYLAQNGGTPKLFIAEVQNQTSEAYFPIGDMNDELLNELSASGDFVLVDTAAREKILGEVKYQNDGMVDPKTAKQIGKQTGADIMIFGNVYMKPEKRDGKTIKEYSVNIRMTDVEKAVEVMRARTKVFKYSEKSTLGL
ncbi:MAG: penicillin-binding protein activator LpoB [Bacteriovoracaceae bacterium]|nr:penicillin-binding protein activator LpoB [Bacteriovoracaceae bacterium]